MNKVGDFIRNGDTTKDAYHSVVVAVRGSTVMSMNRCNGQLFLHIWLWADALKAPGSGIEHTEVTPIGSMLYAPLKEEFLNDERDYKAQFGHGRT